MEALLRCVGCNPALQREVARLRDQLHMTRDALVKRCPADDWSIVQTAERNVSRMYECKICMEKKIEVVVLPCGHAFSCRACHARTPLECSICRTKIEAHTYITFQT